MIKRFVLAILMVVFVVSVALAQHQDGWVDDYRGVIGDNLKIGMSITTSANNVSGEYFYSRWLKDIPIKGKIDGRNIILSELDEHGKVTAIFKGRFLDHAPEYLQEPIKYEVIEGEWSRPDGSERKRFRVTLESSTAMLGKSRYSVAGFESDQAIEAVAQKFKKAVLVKDKESVASLVEYPISVKVKGKAVEIKNRADFIKKYDAIFHNAFLDRIKESVPHNMFAKADGVMLGDRGEIWFGDRGGKAKITAINNDADEIGKFKVLWRINNGADIVLDEDYLKKIPDQLRAIIGYVSAQAGTDCWWDNDKMNDDMSNLKCKLTTALALGYQGAKKHKEFLHYWFRNDPKLSKFDGFCTVPYTATIQNTFSFINMQMLGGGEYAVEYQISWVNSREDKGGFEKIEDRFRVFSDQVIMTSHKIVKEAKN